MSEQVLETLEVAPVAVDVPVTPSARPVREGPRLDWRHLDLVLILVGLGVLFVLPVAAPRPQ